MPQPGSAWYGPDVRWATANEPRCEAGVIQAQGTLPSIFRIVLTGTVLSRRLEINVWNMMIRIMVIGLGMLVLWAILGKTLMEPGGVVFDPLAMFSVSSVFGGGFSVMVGLPTQIGIHWFGVIWHNIPRAGYLTSGIVKEIRTISGRIGLLVIVSRAGFATDLDQLRQTWKSVLCLSLIPMTMEAVVHALVAKTVLDLPDYRWAFAEGFLVSAIAPGVIVPPLLGLRGEGYGTQGGASQLMMTSVVPDACFCIWATNFFIDLVFSDMPVGLAVALGPIQLIVGFGIGIAFGFLIHVMTKIMLSEAKPQDQIPGDPTSPLVYPAFHLDRVHYRLVGLYSLFAAAFVFLSNNYGVAGGGAIAVLSMAGTISRLWRPLPPIVSVPAPTAAEPIAIADAAHPQVEAAPVDAMNQSLTSLPDACADQGDGMSIKVVSQEIEDQPQQAPGQLARNASFNATILAGAPTTAPPNPNDDLWDEVYNYRTRSHKGDTASVVTSHTLRTNAVVDPKTVEPVVCILDPAERFRLCEEGFFPAQRARLFAEFGFFWDDLAMPALFAFSGTLVVLPTIFSESFFPKAFGVLMCGVTVRFILAIICTAGSDFNVGQRLLVGFGWIGKAAVQAALAGTALTKAQAQNPQDPEKIKAAKTLLNMSMMAAILLAPLGAAMIIILGRKFLPYTPPK